MTTNTQTQSYLELNDTKLLEELYSNLDSFNTFHDIKNAISLGIPVFWKTSVYVVRCVGCHYYVTCILNGDTVGLFHIDGVTSDYKPEDFFSGSKG